jgi:hypothetical protein
MCGADYVVLDDIRKDLPDYIANAASSKEDESYFRRIYGRSKNVPLEEILDKNKGSWMTNQQCLRSLFKLIKKPKNFIGSIAQE